MMQNGTLSVTATGNSLTAALKTKAGADPSAGDPVIVSFLDRAGGYRDVGITGPLSTTIPAGATGGAPSLLPFRGWWHMVDGPSPQIGLAVYSGPSRILRPRDGGLINAVVPGNNPFAVYTPSAVSNASARVIASSQWEGGLPVAGQWSAPTNTDLWLPGMPLPLDIIDAVQSGPPPNQTVVNSATPNQWYATNLSCAITLKSTANFVQTQWCGNAFASSHNDQITVGLFRNGAHVGILNKAQAADTIVCGVGGSWLDFPGVVGPINYAVKMKSWAGGTIAFSYQEGAVAGNEGQPVLQLAEVMG